MFLALNQYLMIAQSILAAFSFFIRQYSIISNSYTRFNSLCRIPRLLKPFF
jgi:hypothetical protein